MSKSGRTHKKKGWTPEQESALRTKRAIDTIVKATTLWPIHPTPFIAAYCDVSERNVTKWSSGEAVPGPTALAAIEELAEDLLRFDAYVTSKRAWNGLMRAVEGMDYRSLLGTRWKSVKRGTIYTVENVSIGQAPGFWLLGDNIPHVHYREYGGGTLYSRPLWHFYMRFWPVL